MTELLEATIAKAVYSAFEGLSMDEVRELVSDPYMEIRSTMQDHLIAA